MSQGLITIAYGSEKYIRMAKGLAKSYRRFNCDLPLAIVTDEKNRSELSKYFDEIIIVNSDYGHGVVQKLHIDLYSPYDETLFIDSDCLFYKDPRNLWNTYAIGDFCVRGWRYLTGKTAYEQRSPYEWVLDLPEFLRKNGIEKLPHFNSGVFYFKAGPLSKSVFESAREVYRNREQLGFRKFKNAPIADEPAFAVAIEKLEIPMEPWDPEQGMQTAINVEKFYAIDVTKGQAHLKKGGVDCKPTLLHFNVDAQYSFVYNRELARIESAGTADRFVREFVFFPANWMVLQSKKYRGLAATAISLLRDGKLSEKLAARRRRAAKS